ncbi:hypothetical protein [Kineococcus aurantiacus]|uniref:HEAT repeat domain-containing protein n=1 Tax=Kineococcus aurantiacus TaxID=37633 RepID=A0A7Y9DQK5_9ACTN|nr:hypothetical protein [Kineococcus aurantiacus]NYD25001.1 hypothetical protein [Kineococcus aurantiacus]
MTPPRRGPIKADELLAQLANDPEYQARIAERDRRIEQAAARRTAEAQPVLDDLHSAGIEIKSLWLLDWARRPYPEALPILFKHFRGGERSDEILGLLARLLKQPYSPELWVEFRDRYKAAPPGSQLSEGLAEALDKLAKKAHFEDLKSLIADPANGPSRILLLGTAVRVGRDEGRAFLAGFRDDPVLGKEATLRSRPRK